MKPTGYESIPMQTLPDVVEAAKVALAEALAVVKARQRQLAMLRREVKRRRAG